MSEAIEHKSARIILEKDAEPPKDVVLEDKLVRWADALYLNSMRITAAGVYHQTGDVGIAASVLWWANYSVPAGYLSEEELTFTGGDGRLYEYELNSEEALQRWVEHDFANDQIGEATGSKGLYLAGTGTLMDRVTLYADGSNDVPD